MSELVFGIVGMIVGVVGVIFGAVNVTRNKQTDDKREGREDGILLTEIGYVKAGVDDLKRDNRDIRVEIQAMHDKITQTAESCKQAHKRIDSLEKYHQPN